MKELILTVAILFSPLLVAGESSSSNSDRFVICYLDGNAIMLQPNMCLAKGGIRGS